MPPTGRNSVTIVSSSKVHKRPFSRGETRWSIQGLGHAGGNDSAGHPEAAGRYLLSGLAATASTASGTGYDRDDRGGLPPGGLDPKDGTSRPDAVDLAPVEVPVVRDGQGPRPDGHEILQPPSGCRRLSIRMAGCFGHAVPGWKPHRQLGGRGGHGGQHGRTSGDPGHGCLHDRGRNRLVGAVL